MLLLPICGKILERLLVDQLLSTTREIYESFDVGIEVRLKLVIKSMYGAA